MGELFAWGWTEEWGETAALWRHAGSELEPRERLARAARVALAVRQEGGRGCEVRAERVVLRDAMLEEDTVAHLQREQLDAGRRAQELFAVEIPYEGGEGEAPLAERRGGGLLGHLVLARALLCERLKAGVHGDPVVRVPVDGERAPRGAVAALEEVGDDGVGEWQLALGDQCLDAVLVYVLAAHALAREADHLEVHHPDAPRPV